MDLSLTAQFFTGCGFVLMPFAILAAITEAALGVILLVPRRAP